ncbi:hypothetical protein M9H77_08548 [Catharanthus roseus]|uniref:Uncharacterized protein n=1 Tax=Catharanthus roseus TaxID=4058 RepID=A0ACC0BYF4_CATRO|nr:hypothetical protein M9H77_08548 [Catharanthus roseus]
MSKKKEIMPLIPEKQVLLRVEEEEEIPLAEVRRDNLREPVNMNIMNKAAHRLADNRTVQKKMVDKYKKDLEKNCQEQVIMLDRGEGFREKFANVEAANTTLVETNSSLMEINER